MDISPITLPSLVEHRTTAVAGGGRNVELVHVAEFVLHLDLALIFLGILAGSLATTPSVTVGSGMKKRVNAALVESLDRRSLLIDIARIAEQDDLCPQPDGPVIGKVERA